MVAVELSVLIRENLLAPPCAVDPARTKGVQIVVLSGLLRTLPVGRGLFGFRGMDDVLTAIGSGVTLKWSDKLGGSSNDYDLFILNSTGTAIKGIGQWSVDMALMFALARPDVLPVGDLGIRSAVRELYQLSEMPNPTTLASIAEPWRPYRTVACWYLWRRKGPVPQSD